MSTSKSESSHKCMFCKADNNKHPLYLYMITDRRIPISDLATSSNKYHHIGLSSHPFIHTHCQNRVNGFRAGVKSTKAIAPYWVLQLTIEVRSDAKLHKMAYKKAKKEKKLIAFLQHIYKLAVEQDTPIYCKDPDGIQRLIVASSDDDIKL